MSRSANPMRRSLYISLFAAALVAAPANAYYLDMENSSLSPTLQSATNVSGSSATITTIGPRSGSRAVQLTGHDDSATVSAAYYTLQTMNYFITPSTVLEYDVKPVDNTGRYTAVDLALYSSQGSLIGYLHDSTAKDQWNVSINPNAQGNAHKLTPYVYNHVSVNLGSATLNGASLVNKSVKAVLIGYNQPAGSGMDFTAVFDDVRIHEPTVTPPARGVRVVGTKIGAGSTDKQATLTASGLGSVCYAQGGPVGTDEKCAASITNYEMLVTPNVRGYVQIKASFQNQKDILASVCMGNPGAYGDYNCTEPASTATYCRPYQSSLSATVKVYLKPGEAPGVIGVNWKYVTPSEAALAPACEPHTVYRVNPATKICYDADTDGSGSVSVTDGVQILRCAAHIIECSGQPGFDPDGSGATTVSDGVIALQVAAGIAQACGADRDGDGLPDKWESGPIDLDGDGHNDVDLKQLGASPTRKDVFVECDYMSQKSGTASFPAHNHKLSNAIKGIVRDAFDHAATGNGTIELHVLDGRELTADGTNEENQVSCDRVKAYKRASWGGSMGYKASVFHYCLVGHGGSKDTDWCANRSSSSLDAGGGFYIHDHGYSVVRTDAAYNREQAAHFMRGLGFDLGLEVGGGDKVDKKPNYLSVMNTTFAVGLLKGGTQSKVDYSRFNIEPLDEANLDERVGLRIVGGGSSDLEDYGTGFYRIPSSLVTVQDVSQPINWNGNTTLGEFNVHLDINASGGPLNVLNAQNDWANLNYRACGVGGIWDTSKNPADRRCEGIPPAN